MTWEEATDALLQHFRTRWSGDGLLVTGIHPTVPIHYPNAKPVTADSEAGAWVRLRFLPAYSRRIVLGGQTRQQGGIVVVNTFVPLSAGDGLSVSYGREIEAIWEDAHDEGLDGAIHLFGPSGEGIDQIPASVDPDIPAWRAGVTVPFTIYHRP